MPCLTGIPAWLLKLAGNDSPLAGLRPDDVISTKEGLAKRDEADRFKSYTSILTRAGRNELVDDGNPPMPFELQHWSMHSYCAMFWEVRVNAVTGEPRVNRFLGSFDCGRIMNPSLSDYHIPVHLDVPEIEVMWTNIPDPHTPMGAHGVGEIGITGTGAGIANALRR